MTPDEVIARASIGDVLARYCRGIDRRDRAAVAACFHSDATDDHGTGPRPVDEFLDWCFALLAGYDATFHLLGQSVVRVDLTARTAWAETYGIAHHRSEGGPEHRNLITGFRYLDDFAARAGEWRITRRRAVTDWSRVDRPEDRWAVPDDLLGGRAGPDDPSYG